METMRENIKVSGSNIVKEFSLGTRSSTLPIAVTIKAESTRNLLFVLIWKQIFSAAIYRVPYINKADF